MPDPVSRPSARDAATDFDAVLRDPVRLQALQRTELLDAPLEEAFDRLTQLASRILRAPVALVSLVDSHRQFFQSCVGLPEPWASRRETPLSHSFCQHTVVSGEPLVIADARTDPRVWDNLAIPDIGVVAYLGIPLRGAGGEVLGSFCVIDTQPREWTQDEIEILSGLTESVITEIELRSQLREQQRTEQRMRQQMELTSAITTHVAEGLCLIDADGRLLFMNPAAERILGWTEEELLGKIMHDAVHYLHSDGTPFPMSECPLDAVLVNGAPIQNRDDVWIRKNGTFVPVTCTCTAILGEGRITGAVLSIQDVTARKRAEQRQWLLAEAGRRLAASLDYEVTLAHVVSLAVPSFADWCTLLLTDGSGRVRRAEVSARDPAKAALVREIVRRYPYRTQSRTSVAEAIRTGKPQFLPRVSDRWLQGAAVDPAHLSLLRALEMRSHMAVPLIRGEQTFGVLAFNSSAQARPYGADDLALAEELARRAALALDNARLYEEAEEASRAKSDFLAVTSHELRTPLNAILGYVDLLDLGIAGPVTPEQRKYLDRVSMSSRHLLQIIEEILTFSRLEASREEVYEEPIVLADLVEGVAALIEPLAHEKHLSFEVRLRDAPASIVSDARKLRQILINLLGNAVKFTEVGGVELTVGTEPGHLLLAVRDTGPGIEPEDQDKIFEAFWQVNQRTTRRAGGTGLGLSVSRKLARLLGGDVEVKSAGGTGSVFTLRLPLTQ